MRARTLPPAGLDKKRIVVLPLVNMSRNPDDSYLADGITEEVISTLSKVRGMSVISRTSAMVFKGTDKKAKEIGLELDVGSILEGSFRKAGNRIRVVVQLIDVEKDSSVWAESYDREIHDVFAVQSDIAKRVADALRVKILPQEETSIRKAPTMSPDAHALYLRGRYYWNQPSKENLLKAIGFYEAAIELDKDFALAYSGIADCFGLLGRDRLVPYAEAYPKSKEYAAKAVKLDEASAETQASLGHAIWTSDKDFAGAEARCQAALGLNPGYATAHQWYGTILFLNARLERALLEGLRAQELDPLSSHIATFVGVVYDALGRYEEAERQNQRALELQPDFVRAIRNLRNIYWKQERFEDSKRQIEAEFRVNGDEYVYRLALATNFALAGKRVEAKATMAQAEAITKPGPTYGDLRIFYHIALGELEEAVQEFENQYESGADNMVRYAYYPTFSVILTNPKVESILRKFGLSLPAKSPKSLMTLGRFRTNEAQFAKPDVEFKSKGAKTLFDHIVKCFVTDYMVDRLYFEQAGWRTLSEISAKSKVPRSSLYARRGVVGSAIKELRSRGLLEERVFRGERGRGGEVTKVRVAYDKEPVKRYVDSAVLKLK